jgi:class 3 adenylate cyclase
MSGAVRLDSPQTVCAEVIERYGGVIARQVGDGLLVNFGYPQAHEDDEARAVRAALTIIAALLELGSAASLLGLAASLGLTSI